MISLTLESIHFSHGYFFGGGETKHQQKIYSAKFPIIIGKLNMNHSSNGKLQI